MIFVSFDNIFNCSFAFGVFLLSFYLTVPYMFIYWKGFRNRFLFSGVINYPDKKDKFLSDPERFGLKNTTNHSILLKCGGVVNLWLVEPEIPSDTVAFYCHGSSGNRGKKHRVEFYQVLQTLGYTIVTFDYRGYGDSKGTRSNETSVVEDCKTVMDWTLAKFPDSNIIVWGHSLGSGISVRFMSEVVLEDVPQIKGLVLESAFISAMEAAKNFPASKYWNYFRITRGRIAKSLEGVFPTVDLIHQISLPIQLIHAVDDVTIPYSHSVALKKACSSNNKENVELHSAESGQHKYISRNAKAVEAIRTFFEKVVAG